MGKTRVLLICMLPLLCEGLRRILTRLDDVELTSLEWTDAEQIDERLAESLPGLVLVAGEREDDTSTHLITAILNHYAGAPVVWIELETNVIRMYTAQQVPANSADLIDIIRGLGANPSPSLSH